MNEYIKLYLKKRKERFKEIELAKKKLKSLSLVDRNAFNQIIERESISHFDIIFIPFKMTFYIGLFLVLISYIAGVDISIFKIAFFSLFNSMIILTLLFMLYAILGTFFDSDRITKLKLKLLR